MQHHMLPDHFFFLISKRVPGGGRGKSHPEAVMERVPKTTPFECEQLQQQHEG